MRSNAADNKIQVRVDQNTALNLRYSDAYDIELMDGSEKVYRTRTYINEKDENDITFFELLYETDDYRLYLKECKKYIAPIKNRNSFQDDSPDKYMVLNDVYYTTNFISKSPELIEVPKKKKSFLTLFSEKAKPIEKFIKQNRLDLDEREDLNKVFNFYFNA